MVTMQDGKPVPKVIDFALPKATEQRSQLIIPSSRNYEQFMHTR